MNTEIRDENLSTFILYSRGVKYTHTRARAHMYSARRRCTILYIKMYGEYILYGVMNAKVVFKRYGSRSFII